MGYLKKLLILFIFVGLVIGLIMYSESFDSNNGLNKSSTSGSVVYIENGVSGVVTINDPFLNKVTAVNIIFYPLDSGSGFVVNKQGYVITALHVVGDLDALNNQTIKTMNNADMQKYLERAAVTEYVLNVNPQLNSELNLSDSGLLNSAMNANRTTEVLKQQNLVSVTSSNQVIQVKFPNSSDKFYANLIDVGSTVSDQDIALLKIDSTNSNFTALPISSKDPSILQSLNIYGYPVQSNGSGKSTNSSVLAPSVSSGFVTSKTFKNGTNSPENNGNLALDNLINVFKLVLDSQAPDNISTVYYGTNARTEEGFSGGPVVDDSNNVLGILIFSVNSSNQLQNSIKITSSLFLSSKYIIDICRKNNVSIDIV
ncbi:MAG: trypsin-like peptidase domain-containing protein [Clostridiaceae bacterium]|nr:trypsin-like peptidase domain-containing protein [Clostridiaceae bacterium]